MAMYSHHYHTVRPQRIERGTPPHNYVEYETSQPYARLRMIVRAPVGVPICTMRTCLCVYLPLVPT